VRTTLTIYDHLMAELKELAHRENLPLKQVIDRAIRSGLRASRAPSPPRRYRATTHAMGAPHVASFDRALEIAATLEDEQIARKLVLRK
jgi:hypothetical protein